MKNPFFAVIEEKSTEERDKIVTMLFNFAGVKPPKRIKQSTFTLGGAIPEISFFDTRNTAEEENAYKDKGTESYHNLLSQKVNLFQKQKQFIEDYKRAIDSSIIYFDLLIDERNEINDILQLRYLYSKKIIQLFGQGNIKSNEIPREIIEALKEEEIDRFEATTKDLLNVKLNVLDELESMTLSKEEEALNELYIKITDNLSSRVQIYQELQELEQELVSKAELEGIALKLAEQLASSRQNSEDSFKDILFNFIKSAETDNYSDILKSSYVEVIEIEKDQDILMNQVQKLGRLIKLENSENTDIPDILTFLRNGLEQLQLANEEEIAKIEVRLKPQNSDQIISTFEMKTGRRIFASPPIPKNNLNSYINSSADILFKYYLQIATIKRWINLFRYRMTPSGIDKEINFYNSKIGKIEADNAVLDARLREFTGHSQDALDKLDLEDQPKSKLEKLEFLNGKIGALRTTRNQWRMKSAKFIFIKICFIFFLAYILIWGINNVSAQIGKQVNESDTTNKKKSWVRSIVSRINKRFKKPDQKEFKDTNQTSNLSRGKEILPLYSFVKHVLIILIWIIALALFLETIGFKVAAILAGLGIGGFAIAFAIKDILVDFFGGVTIMTNKPFKVGDLILFNGESAKVEEVGIRYSKLSRSSDNNLVTVPNSMLTAKELVNLSHYSGQYVTSEIKLSTKNEFIKVKLAIKIINNIFANIKDDVLFKWVRHDSFNDHSYVLKVKYEILDPSKANTLKTLINTEIIKQFHESGIILS